LVFLLIIIFQIPVFLFYKLKSCGKGKILFPNNCYQFRLFCYLFSLLVLKILKKAIFFSNFIQINGFICRLMKKNALFPARFTGGTTPVRQNTRTASSNRAAKIQQLLQIIKYFIKIFIFFVYPAG